jgi:lysophospholipase L1-like esterase
METANRLVIGDSILKNVRHIRDSSIFSLSGITLDELSHLIPILLDLSPNAKCILVHCGTNNIGRDDTDAIIMKYQSIISAIASIKPSVKILLSSILPKFDKESNPDESVSEINSILWEKCKEWKCEFVASYKVVCRREKPCPVYFYDGIHLNKEGTFRFRQLLLQRLSELGTKPRSVFSSATYLRRNQWQGNVLTNLKDLLTNVNK